MVDEGFRRNQHKITFLTKPGFYQLPMSILLVNIRNRVGVVDTLKLADVPGKELEIPRMGLKSGLLHDV